MRPWTVVTDTKGRKTDPLNSRSPAGAFIGKRRHCPLSSRAEPRDLRFYEPVLEMFFPGVSRTPQERRARRDSISASAASSAARLTGLEVRSERMRSRCKSSSCLCRSTLARSRTFFFAASIKAPEAVRSAADCCSSTDLLSHPRAISLWYDMALHPTEVSWGAEPRPERFVKLPFLFGNASGGIMKVWQIQSFGIDQLVFVDVPNPAPAADKF